MNVRFFKKDIPTSREICSSECVGDLLNSLKGFLEENEIGAKIQLFTRLLISFDNFMNVETNKALLTHYIPKVYSEIMKSGHYTCDNPGSMIQVIKVVTKANDICRLTIKPIFFNTLLVGCAQMSSTYSQLIAGTQPFFQNALKNDTFFKEWSTNDGFVIVFDKIFINSTDIKAADFINNVLFTSENTRSYKDVNLQSLVNLIFNSIKSELIQKELSEKTSIFLANIFIRISSDKKQITKLMNANIFSYLDYLIGMTDFQRRSLVYEMLITCRNEDGSPPPNQLVYKHLSSIFEDLHPMQKPLFILITDIMEKDPSCIPKLNSLYPIENWFRWQDGVLADMIKMLMILDTSAPSIVHNCLPILFRTIIQHPNDIESEAVIIRIIDNQLKCRRITEMYLMESNFLSAFLIEMPKENLQNLFISCEPFSKLALSVFQLPGAISFRPSVLHSILEASASGGTSFTRILTDFLCVDPSSWNIRQVIDFCKENNGSQFISALTSTFLLSNEAPQHFVENGGLQWIFNNFNKYQVDDVIALLSSVVCHRRFDEMEETIEKLDPDHPIFKVPQKLLEELIFGMNTGIYRPIRVRSLVHLLDRPLILDPFNAWQLGQSYIEMASNTRKIDILEVPMIDQIANRYVAPHLLSRFLKSPASLEPLCDPSYDHFPLIQLYPGYEPLLIEQPCIAFSFFFKFEGDVITANEFFKTDNITLSATINKENGGTITCNVCGAQFTCTTQPNQWNFVFAKLESGIVSSSISVTINDIHRTLNSPSQSKNFVNFTFCSVQKTLLYYGASMRFFRTIPRGFDYRQIISKGPGFSNLLAEETTITPNLLLSDSRPSTIKVPSTCVSVLYFGFPMYFLSYSRLAVLLNALDSSKTQSEFDSIFHTLLKIHTITGSAQERFYPMLLGVMTKKTEFLSKDIFIEGLVYGSKDYTSRKVLNSLLFNKTMWESVSNDLLIDSIFEHFGDADFKSLDLFDIYLTNRLVQSKGKPSIIKTLLLNQRIIPTIATYIIYLLKSSGNISSPQIQMNIASTLIDVIRPSNAEIFKSLLPFEDLRALFWNSEKPLQYVLIDLLKTITSWSRSYIEFDNQTLLMFSCAGDRPETWHCAMQIISEFSALHLQEAQLNKALPLLFGLSARAISNIILSRNFGTEFPDTLNQLLSSSSQFIAKHISPEQQPQLSRWLLIGLHALSLFDTSSESDVNIRNFNPQETPEYQNPIWITPEVVLKSFKEPAKPENTGFKLFFARMFGLQKPVENQNPDIRSVLEWLASSPVLDLIASSIGAAGFQALAEYGDLGATGDPVMPAVAHHIVHTAISAALVDTPALLAALASFITVAAAPQPVQLMTDTMALCNVFVGSNGERALPRIAESASLVIFECFRSVSEEELASAVNILRQNVRIFTLIAIHSSTYEMWLYGLTHCPEIAREAADSFIAHIISRNLLDPPTITITEKRSEISEVNYESRYRILKQAFDLSKKRSDFYNNIYKEVINSQHQFNCRSTLINLLFRRAFRILSGAYHAREEKHWWNAMLDKIETDAQTLTQFKPSGFFLSPVCFPFSPSRVLTPLVLPMEGAEIYRQFKANCAQIDSEELNLNLLRLFLTLYNRYGTPTAIMSVSVLRYSDPIPCVMVVYNSVILLVTFASLTEDGTDFDLSYRDELKEQRFLESVTLGHWGRCSVFASKIVVKVKAESIIHVQQMSLRVFSLWSFTAGCFILRLKMKDVSSVTQFLLKLSFDAEARLPPVPFLFQIEKVDDISTKLQMGAISVSQAILVHNALAGRSFVDLSKYPAFPCVTVKRASTEFDESETEIGYFRGFPDVAAAAQSLSSIAPISNFSASALRHTLECDVPASLMFLPEAGGDVFIQSARLAEVHTALGESSTAVSEWCQEAFGRPLPNGLDSRRISHIGDLDLIHTFQVLGGNYRGSIMHDQDSLARLPALSARLDCCRSAAVVVDPNTLSLSFVNFRTGRTSFKRVSSTYSYVSGVAVAQNGLLLTVDFSFGLTRAFFIIYTETVPTGIVEIGNFSWSTDHAPISAPTGADLIVATSCERSVVMWAAVGGRIHRVLRFANEVKAVSFDEPCSALWVLTEATADYVTVNGDTLLSMALEAGARTVPTCVYAFPARAEDPSRAAVVGFSDGGITLLCARIDARRLDQKRLPSPHSSAVRSIALHPSLRTFISAAGQGAVAWTAVGLQAPRLRPGLYGRCPVCCAGTASAFCSRCARCVCEGCLRGGLCSFCAAVDCYIF